MTTSQQLRARTAACHMAVDAAFGTADLSDRADYVAVLAAHARALLPAEAALTSWDMPNWEPRTAALLTDLAGLGVEVPEPLPFTIEAEPEAWGTLYVLEGSRLGNAMLVRQVAAGLPTAYLGARHRQGGWRGLLAMIDAEGAVKGADWVERAVAGAEAAFGLYLRASSGR